MSETPSAEPAGSKNNESEKTPEDKTVPSSDTASCISEKSLTLSDNNSATSASDVKKQSASFKIPQTSKPSGIKPPAPPSRIGRPCGGVQKPAVPSTPTKSESYFLIRMLDFCFCMLTLKPIHT